MLEHCPTKCYAVPSGGIHGFGTPWRHMHKNGDKRTEQHANSSATIDLISEKLLFYYLSYNENFFLIYEKIIKNVYPWNDLCECLVVIFRKLYNWRPRCAIHWARIPNTICSTEYDCDTDSINNPIRIGRACKYSILRGTWIDIFEHSNIGIMDLGE